MLLSLGIFSVQSSAANTDGFVRDLILYYKNYQEKAKTDIEHTLADMYVADSAYATVWTDIMGYWSYVNNKMTIYTDIAPLGLPEDDSMAFVILGYKLNSDGSMKDELIGRLQVGLASAERYPNSYVIVTGGGTASENSDSTEAGEMAKWLIANGLSEDRIIIEDKAGTTVGNAKYTYRMLKKSYPAIKDLVMVTSDYHIPRASLIFYTQCLIEAYQSGGEYLNILTNVAYVTGSEGYESIELQAQGVASVAGVSSSGSIKLSKLSALKVINNNAETIVYALYDSGYEKDVTDTAVFDANSVSYTENGITVSGEYSSDSEETLLFSTKALEELIATAKAIDSVTYTKASCAKLAEALMIAEDALEDPEYEKVLSAAAELEAAIESLDRLINIAYKMNVSANCNQGNAYKINDGTVTTSNYWASVENGSNIASKDAEITIDLDGLYNVEGIRVYPYWKGERIYKYELYGSTDGNEWIKIGENVSDTYITDKGVTHSVDGNYSYIKLKGIETTVSGRSDINNIHIIEMQVFGEEVNNIALNKPVSSSGSDHSVSSSADATDLCINDGDRTNYWDAGLYKDEPYAIIDLEGTYVLDSINVIAYWMRTDNRYYHYDIYTSNDGESYEKVTSKTSDTPETPLGESYELNGRIASHIKIAGIYNSANTSFHINEIRAYGKLADCDDLGHCFSEYVSNNDATCTTDGTKTAKCERCDATDTVTDEGSATGHTESNEWIVIEPATYDYEGYRIMNCSVCSTIVKSETIPVLIYKGFPDVSEDAWYYTGVRYCATRNYIAGNDKGEFMPSGKLTREQFVVILARVSGAKLSEYTDSSFADVNANAWYGPSVIWANKEGYVNGVGDGTKFGVGQDMTREQLAAIFFRYATQNGVSTDKRADLSSYTDVSKISSWAKDSCAWAAEAGLLGSTDKAKLVFSPKMTVTRAQAAKIFMSYSMAADLT